jgi:hypothetical protein
MDQSMENFQEDDEIDLLELWAVLWRGKWFIMGFALACTLVAVYMTLYVRPVMHKSNTVLLPNKSDAGASRLSGLVGSLPSPGTGQNHGSQRTHQFQSPGPALCPGKPLLTGPHQNLPAHHHLLRHVLRIPGVCLQLHYQRQKPKKDQFLKLKT